MIVLYGKGYDSQDLVGRQVKLLTEDHNGEILKIIAVNHYGFLVENIIQMHHWYDEDKTWSWVEQPDGRQ